MSNDTDVPKPIDVIGILVSLARVIEPHLEIRASAAHVTLRADYEKLFAENRDLTERLAALESRAAPEGDAEIERLTEDCDRLGFDLRRTSEQLATARNEQESAFAECARLRSSLAESYIDRDRLAERVRAIEARPTLTAERLAEMLRAERFVDECALSIATRMIERLAGPVAMPEVAASVSTDVRRIRDAAMFADNAAAQFRSAAAHETERVRRVAALHGCKLLGDAAGEVGARFAATAVESSQAEPSDAMVDVLRRPEVRNGSKWVKPRDGALLRVVDGHRVQRDTNDRWNDSTDRWVEVDDLDYWDTPSEVIEPMSEEEFDAMPRDRDLDFDGDEAECRFDETCKWRGRMAQVVLCGGGCPNCGGSVRVVEGAP
jgi:hypothetical protein